MALGCEVDWDALAKILDAIAWPIVAAVMLWNIRTPLRTFLDRVASRATKVSVGDYSVELLQLQEVTPSWQAMNLDVRKLTSSQVFDSGSESLFEQLTRQERADYVIIDLGTGDQWLSSRLFIFAVVLGRVRGVNALAFVATKGDISRHYLGSAEPEAVHLALAKRFPWFEAALATASQPLGLPYDAKQSSEPFALLAQSTIDLNTVRDVVRRYIEAIQLPVAPPGNPEWQSLQDFPSVAERTAWLTQPSVDDILFGVLQRGYAISSAEKSKQDISAAVLRSPGKFVALVDEDRRLLDLVDRTTVVDRFVMDSVTVSKTA